MKLLLFGCLLLGSLHTQAQYSQQQMQNLYLSHLRSIGIKGFVDSDSDVQFEYEGHKYYIDVMDNKRLRVVLFNVWEAESNQELVEMTYACSEVNRIHYVKAYIDEDNKLNIASELIFKDVNRLSMVLSKILDKIEEALDTFIGEM